MMMNTVWGAWLTIGGLSGLSIASMLVARYPIIGVLATGVTVVTLWELPNPAALFSISGFSVYYSDLVAIVLFVVACINQRQLRTNLGALFGPWCLWGFGILFSIVRGLLAFSPGPVGNEARFLLPLFFCLSWAMSIDWTRYRPSSMLISGSLTIGWSLSIVAIYHAARYGIGGATTSIILADGDRMDGRILLATQAIVLLACGALIMALRRGRYLRLQFLSAMIFGAIALLSQNRSVWVALLVGIGVMLLVSSWRVRRGVVAIAVIASWGAAIVVLTGAADSLLASLQVSATSTNTLFARESSWQQLVQQAWSDGPIAVLFGEPFGSGYERVEPNGLVETYTPHNWYVTLFLRTGVVGLVAFVSILAVALVRSWRRSHSATFMITAYLAFSWTYAINWYMHAWLGWAIVVGLRDRSPIEGEREKLLPRRVMGAR